MTSGIPIYRQPDECTADEYLKHGARVTTIRQLSANTRAIEYGLKAWRRAVLDHDPQGAADLASAAVAFAKLAFVDLEEEA